jgi:quercetin dioxygenase-like cupin family protein
LDVIRTADLVDELLAIARDSGSGRGARTIHGGRDHALRQTVIALVSGRALDEHESPGEATLKVLAGRVRLVAGEDAQELVVGDFVVIPPHRHHLDALEDSAVLLTVAMSEAAPG